MTLESDQPEVDPVDSGTSDSGATDMTEVVVRSGGNRTVLFAALAFGVCMLAMIGFLATRDAQQGLLNSNQIEGQVAPLVSGPTMDGEIFDLAEYRGQWVLVNFFATWCVGCIQEHPELVEFSDRHSARNEAQVVSVVFGDDPEEVVAFFTENGGDWPVIVDEATSREFVLSYGVTAVPETYIISPSGRVVEKLTSAAGVTADALDRFLGFTE